MLFLDENSIPYSPVPLKTPESMAPAESIAPDLFPAGTSASVSAGTAKDISCRLCPRQCRILPERYGVCRVRKNTKNKIIPVTYGYPVKWKRLTADLLPWHFTDPETRIAAIAGFGCPLACKDCHDSVLSAKGFFKKGVSWHYYRPELQIRQIIRWEAKGIIFDGNEPGTWKEYVRDIFAEQKKNHLFTGLITCGFLTGRTIRYFLKIGDKINLNCRESVVDHPLFPWENLRIISAFPKQASVTWNVPDYGDPTAKSLDFFSLLAQYILPNQANALPVMIRGGGRDQDPKELVRKIKKRYPVIRKNCNFRILPS